MKKRIVLFVYSLITENLYLKLYLELYLKLYLSGTKIGIIGFIRKGLCSRRRGGGGGAYTWSDTSVQEKVGLSAGAICGRGAYRRKNTVPLS